MDELKDFKIPENIKEEITKFFNKIDAMYKACKSCHDKEESALYYKGCRDTIVKMFGQYIDLDAN